MQLLLGRAYDDKDVQEVIVRRSGLDWIIARPGILTNRPKTGRYKVRKTFQSDWRSGFISRADVADFLVKQVERCHLYYRETPDINQLAGWKQLRVCERREVSESP